MKKHFLKPALLVLMLAVLVGAIFGISALADSSSTTATPEIVSKNVSYSSKLHLYYAVPVSSIEGTPSIKVFKTEPTDVNNATPDYTITSYTTQSISVITGEAQDYYVFRSNGVAAKDIANSVWAVPVSTKDGVATAGAAVEYSIAEYCFERLTRDGYLAVSKSEIKEYERRELYMSLLEYAHNAQQVLASDANRTEIKDLAYYSITGSDSDGCGFASSLNLSYNTNYKNAADGWNFKGWSVYTFNPATGEIDIAILEDGAKATFTGAALITPEYNLTGTALYETQLAEQQKKDAAYIEYRWEVVESKLAAQEYENVSEVVAALKQVYTMYNGDTTTLNRLDGDKFEVVAEPNGIADLVEWIAALYAKGYNDIPHRVWAGGFYANLDAVGTVGYGPDVQCTAQLLSFMQTSGMLDSVSAEIPEWMGTQIAYFAKTLQDTNGYFYHPQWGRSVGVSRVGRDLGWATSLLGYFGAQPTYDTPRNGKGDGLTADEYKQLRVDAGYDVDAPTATTAYMTAPLSEGSIAKAVSQVVLASDTDDSTTSVTTSVTAFSKYLVDGETFLDYLYANIDMLRNAYSAGNTLNANHKDIGAKDKEYAFEYDSESMPEYYEQYNGMNYREILITYINNYINPNTGLFGGWNGASGQITDNDALDNTANWSTMEGVINFANSNGFFKVISIYTSWGFVFPEIELAFNSLINNLTNPEVTTGNNACDVYNVWNAIGSVRGQVTGRINAANALLGVAGTSKSSYNISSEVTYTYDDEGALTSESIANLEAYAAKFTEFRADIEATLKENAAAAIRLTYDRMNGYKAVDGGFSHGYNRRVGTHQGAPVAPSGDKISDVDATCITSTGLVRSMFSALGLGDPIEFFGKGALMQFVNLVENAPEVSKVNDVKITEEFQDYEVGANVGNTEDETSNTINIPNIKFVFSTSTLASAAIVEEGDNKFLRFTDNQGEGIQTYPEFKKISEAGIGSVIFEAKMRFNQTAGSNFIPITLLSSNSTVAYYGSLILSANNTLNVTVTSNKDLRAVVPSGQTGLSYDSNAWYTVKLVYNTTAKTCTITVTNAEGEKLEYSENIATVAVDASAVTVARMACFSNWIGTIDYDDVKFCSANNAENGCAHVIGTKYNINTQATCTEIGQKQHVTYCQIEGCEVILEYGEITDLEMLDHEFDTENSANNKAANAATCEAAGNHAYYYCTVCNNYVKSKVKTDAAYREYWTVLEGQTIDDVVYIAATGHAKGESTTTWSEHTINALINYEGYLCANGCGTVCGEPTIASTFTYTAPENSFNFSSDSYVNGADWTYNTSGNVLINHYKQSASTTENKIVTENGVKYLSLDKTAGASSNAQTWAIFQRTLTVNKGPIVFEARMRTNSTQTTTSSYLRFYDGSTITTGNDGEVFGTGTQRNILFKVDSGQVTFNGSDLNVDPGEWFTLRLVLLGQTVTAISMDAAGNVLKTVPVDCSTRSSWAGQDLINCDNIVWMNDGTTLIDMDFHSVYFGAASVECVDGCTAGAVRYENVNTSCTEEGTRDAVTYCVNCGCEMSRAQETVPAAGHSIVHVEAKAPTCAAEGNSEHYKCSVCDALFADEAASEPLATATLPKSETHTGEIVTTNPIRIVAGGSIIDTVKTCQLCGEETERILGTEFATEYQKPHYSQNFADSDEGAWTNGAGTQVLIGTGKQSHAIYETKVVSDSGNNVLIFNKSGTTVAGSSTAMAWLALEKTANLAENSDIVFEARMTYTHTSGNLHIRLYKDREAANPNVNGVIRIASGEESKLDFDVSNGNVTLGGTSVGAKEGGWFTLRLVVSGTTLTAYSVALDGTTTELSSFSDENLRDLRTVQFTGSSTEMGKIELYNVYFGGEITYGEECVAGEAVQENYVAPTCTDEGSYDAVQYCVHCGKEIEGSRTTYPVAAKGHGTIEAVAAKAPTCAAEGNIAHYKCADCGELFEDANGSVTATLADVTLPIDPTAHGNITTTTEATPRIDAGGTRYYTVSTCDVCGNVTAELPGEYVDVYDAPHYSQNFADSDEGAWANGNGTNVLIGHNRQTNTTGSSTVVTENGEKILVMDKKSTGSSSAQSWVLFQRTQDVEAGADVVFEARMNLTWNGNSTGHGGTYFRFYKGRTASNLSNGVQYKGATNNTANLFIYISSGMLHVDANTAKDANDNVVAANDAQSLGVKPGEWFTLRITLNDLTIKVETIGLDNTVLTTVTYDMTGLITNSGADLEECDSIALFTNGGYDPKSQYHSVYFGGTPVYEECKPLAATQEDYVAPTCVSAGGYYEVTHCADCGNLISKTWVTLEATGVHGVANGECVMCGDHFTYAGMINLEDLAAADLAASTATVYDNADGVRIAYKTESAAKFAASIISENANKFLRTERTAASISSWVNVSVASTTQWDNVVFEARARLNASDGIIYHRFYTGDRYTDVGGGSRTSFAENNITISSDKVKYVSAVTHVDKGDWFTMRTTYNRTDGAFVFYILNETTAPITFNSNEYGVGEWIPYYSATKTSGAYFTATAFMQNTSFLGTFDLDDVYFGNSVPECIECVAGEAALETYIDAQCTIAGEKRMITRCKDCGRIMEIGEEVTAIPATGHSLEHTEALAETCTTAGNLEYYYCAKCDGYYLDADATQSTTKDAITIAKLSHDTVGTEIIDSQEQTSSTTTLITYHLSCSMCGAAQGDALTKTVTYTAPTGSELYDNYDAGDLTDGTGTNVQVGSHNQSTDVVSTFAIVTDGEAKYLKFRKELNVADANGEIKNRMTWIDFTRTQDAGSDGLLYFEITFRLSSLNSNKEAHLRFYNGGRTASSPNGGSSSNEISSSARPGLYVSETSVYLNKVAIGAADKWITIRIVLGADNAKVYVWDAAQSAFVYSSTISIAGLNATKTVQYTYNTSTANVFDVQNVYFAGTPASAYPNIESN